MTSTDYEHPFRPAPVRLLNRLGRAGSNLGLSDRLDAEALREAARRKTGLSDFGDDGHAEALEVLVTSINAEARLSATGRLIQRSRLTGALVQRLRIEELLQRHPEIADIDLGNIAVISGLQRTGTTLLHRLLISHPDFRGLSGAEALMPVPGAPDSDRAERARKRQAVLAQKSISYLAPEFMAIHPISHDEPEEDVLLLDLCFMSQSAEATMHVPTYARWLESQDQTPAYEYLRRVLQVLSWQRPGGRWVLKTPHHLEHLDVLLRVFEGATVVQTHRDPRIALASFCSMVAHGRGMFSDQVDPAEIGRHWCAKTHRMVERADGSSSRVTGRSVHRRVVLRPHGRPDRRGPAHLRARRNPLRRTRIGGGHAVPGGEPEEPLRQARLPAGGLRLDRRHGRRGVRGLPRGLRDPHRERPGPLRRATCR